MSELPKRIKTSTFSTKVCLIILLTILIRLPVLLYPKAIDDERTYAVVATEMLDGGLAYVDAIERKPPLLFWVYMGVFKIGGKYNWHFLHFVGLLWVLLSMLGLFKIAKHLFNKNTGLIAALFYSIFVQWAIWKNVAFNGEILMNLPIIWGVYFVFKGSIFSQFRLLKLFAAGMLLCCGFLLKQPGAIMALPLGLYLLVPKFQQKNLKTFFHSIFDAFLYTSGFIATLGIVAIILHTQGNLEEAYYWTIGDHDVPHGVFDPVFWLLGSLLTLFFVFACSFLVVGATIAVIRGKQKTWGLWKDKSLEFYALIGLLFAAIIGIAFPGRFYPHCYIQIIPILCLLAAPVFAAIWQRKKNFKARILQPKATIVWLGLTICCFFCSHTIELVRRSKLSEVGIYFRKNTTADEKIFVWGQCSYLYLDTERKPASRYIATFPLTGYIFGSPLSWDPTFDTSNRILPDAWQNLRQDFLNHPPDYIVDCYGVKNDPRYKIQQFPYLHKLLENCYALSYVAKEGLIYKRKEMYCQQIELSDVSW